MRWLIMLVALATLTAGCFGGGGARVLTQEEAEAATTDAMLAFASDFSSPDGGALTKVAGVFTFSGGGTDAAEFVFEWGLDGSAAITVDAAGAAPTAIALYCNIDGVVIVIAGQSAESRPRPDGACLESLTDATDPLNLTGVSDLEPSSVTANKDGTVTATYSDEVGDITVTLDTRQRLSRMDIDTSTGDGSLTMSYGPRRVLTVPEADARIPASIEPEGQHDGQTYTWAAMPGDERQPSAEFEVRVINQETGQVAATFDIGENAAVDGFSFTFTDDGDDLFGAGDSFTISRDGWNSVSQYDVVIWDRWADRAVGDAPIPGPGALLVIGLLAALVARRR